MSRLTWSSVLSFGLQMSFNLLLLIFSSSTPQNNSKFPNKSVHFPVYPYELFHSFPELDSEKINQIEDNKLN